MNLSINQELPEYSVVAHNYAEESSNKIHSDEFAGAFGYRGGLVPGVGVYAYMTVPVVQVLGVEWLERGSMNGKFIKPTYDGETVTIQARVTDVDPVRIVVSAINAAGELCAVGQASLPPAHHEEFHLHDYPLHPLPLDSERMEPEISDMKGKTLMGTLEYTIDLQNPSGEFANFLDEMRDSLEIYRGPNAQCHPALVAHQANQILVRNVNLGPWIHTASDVRHHALPRHGEVVTLRGAIVHAYSKRNHDIAVMDLALIGDHDRLLTHLSHTAIIKPSFTKSVEAH